MQSPIVSVICLSFNHERFIEEAVQSVLNQTYPAIELILADDASKDGTPYIIERIKNQYPQIKTLLLTENLGNCKAFNKALALATGDFIIDLAADDILYPERVTRQVSFFQQHGPAYGVVFSDARYIDASGKHLYNHFEYIFKKDLIKEVPQGDIFSIVIKRYFIPSATLMVRKELMDTLQGYDETLAYEDFDFWVRSSRISLYGFIPEILTTIRKHSGSMSEGWYKKGDKQLHSTYLICLKILKLCRNEDELKSLEIRVRYELRQSVFSHNRTEAIHFYTLLRTLKKNTITDNLLIILSRTRLPVSWIRSLYHTIRFS